MQPFQITLQKALLRSLSGFVGGIAGTILILAVFVLASGVFQNVLSEDEVVSAGLNPVFLAVFLIMIFLGFLGSNLASPFLLGIVDKNTYLRSSSVLYQIFIYNIVIFFLSLPLYILSIFFDVGTLAFIALVHSFVTFFSTHMIIQGMNQQRYYLLSVYSTSLGLLGAVLLNIFLFKLLGTVNILLFTFLPLCWGMMTTLQCLFEALYNVFYKMYGLDFLRVEVNYGKDTVETKTETEEETISKQIDTEMNEKKDVSGAEFLVK